MAKLMTSNLAGSLVLALGMGLTAALYFFIQSNIESGARAHFEMEAQTHAANVEAAIEQRLMQVVSVANLFSTSKWVSKTEFDRMIELVYKEFPANRRVTWVNWGDAATLKLIEEQISQDAHHGIAGFRFFDLVEGQAVPIDAARQEKIAGVTYSFPDPHMANLIGRNLRGLPIWSLIRPAFEQGLPELSGFRSALAPASRAPFFMIVYPIGEVEERQSSIKSGAIISSNYLPDLFHDTVTQFPNTGFTYLLIANNGTAFEFPSERLFINADDVAIPDERYQVTVPFKVVNQEWDLRVVSNAPAVLNTNRSLLTLIAFAGVALSLLVAGIVRLILNQNQRLTSGIRDKTTQIANVNADLEQALVSAKSANDAKSAFLSNMSHEMRTPLNGIVGLTELCLRTSLNSKQVDYLSKVKASAHHLGIVISDILDFSKIESGHLELDCHPFSLHAVIDQISASLGAVAEAKGIEFSCSISERTQPDMFGDSVRLTQVLMNLCSNAIKFTERGFVKLSLDAEPLTDSSQQRLECCVEDTGIGIDPDQLRHLFERFSQADVSTTRKYGGTGLGLSISQELCRLMGGEIRVTSKASRGSKFVATINLEVNDCLVQGDSQLNFPGLIRVLVLDDSAAARQILSETLTLMGAEVVAERDASLGLELLEQQEFDAIVLDWTMPVMNGQTFVQSAKAKGLIKDQKVLVLSAYDVNLIRVQLFDSSIEVLQKPCTDKQLFDALTFDLTAAEDCLVPEEELLMNLHILVAEDNLINQQLVEGLLEDYGATVTLAENGREAIEVLANDRSIDLVLMDINMPVMDGIAAVKKIRKDSSLKNLPIIALSANVSKADVDHYLEVGMNSHIGKPFQAHELAGRIRSSIVSK